MMTAVDGCIDCAMTEQLPGVQKYYSTLDSLAAPSRVSGRVTAQLEMARPGTFEPQDAALGHESFSRNADADGYEIVIDTRGTLLWDEPDASERVSRDYLAYLGGLHISWIACGKERVDLARACEILASAFGVERMAVVGGGHINAAFLAAGLLDEVSVLIGAGIDGRRVRRPAHEPAAHAAAPRERQALRERRGLAALYRAELRKSVFL